LHARQVHREMVFARQSVHAREVINPLIRLHAVKFIDLNVVICPKKVPFVVWVRIVCLVWSPAQSHLEHVSCDVANNIVLG